MIKKTLFVMAICALMSTPAFAVATIQFANTTGDWSYDHTTNTLSFSQDILITKGLNGSTTDTVIGSKVVIPDLVVGNIPGGPLYTLTPAGGGAIRIESSGGTVYMTGTLGTGYLDTSGNTGSAYPDYNGDITGFSVTAAGQGLGSYALDAIHNNPGSWLDFEMTLSGATGGFEAMLDGGTDGTDSLSGSMKIPAPGAVLLGSIGVGLVGWLKRRRML